VNGLWKVCKAGQESETGPGYGSESEEFGTDFQHEGTGGNPVTTGELSKISTSAKCLLLLLV